MISGNAAINAGISAGNINITKGKTGLMDFSESTIAEQERQALVLERVERERRARAIIVTTVDEDAKVQLRALGRPICLFGEGPGDRRMRLKEILAQMQIEGENIENIQRLLGVKAGANANDIEMGEGGASTAQGSTEIGEKEEFYTAANTLLVEARKRILKFSSEKAKNRLESERLHHRYKNKKIDQSNSSHTSNSTGTTRITNNDVNTPSNTASGNSNSMMDVERTNNNNEDSSLVDNDVHILYKSLLSMEPVVSQMGSRRTISCCRFRPKGDAMITGDWTGLVKLWNTKNYEEERSFIGHTERVTACAWHPSAGFTTGSNKFVTGGADSVALIWSENQNKPLQVLKGHLARLSNVAWHPLGQYIGTSSYDSTWRLWDVETAQDILLQEGHGRETYALNFHPDGSLAASGDLLGIGRVWDIRSGQAVKVLRGHLNGLLTCSFSPNGHHLATGGHDNSIRIWDLRKNDICLYTMPAHNHMVSDLTYAKNSGEFLVSASYDKKIKIWSSRSYKPIKILQGHEKFITAVDISHDESQILSSGADLTWKLYSPSTY